MTEPNKENRNDKKNNNIQTKTSFISLLSFSTENHLWKSVDWNKVLDSCLWDNLQFVAVHESNKSANQSPCV